MNDLVLNYSHYCLNQSSLRLTTTETDDLVLRYLFPPLFFLGLVGNFFNLCVLCSKEMRNRANDLLAAVSLSDFMFFVVMSPHSLAVHLGQSSITYRRNYLRWKLLLGTLANWMYILAVSLERFFVVRRPLYARSYWYAKTRFFTLATIFISTFLLTIYHLWEYDCKLINFCNFTQVQIFCSTPKNDDANDLAALRIYYIQISTLCNVVFVVFIPILAVSILTLLLIRQLRLNDMLVLNNLPNRRTVNTQQTQRRRVTFTVVLISISFSSTQLPSAVLCLFEFFAGNSSNLNLIYKAVAVANALVIFGKTINFLLFCTVSAHFRHVDLGNTELGRLSIRNSLVHRYSTRTLPNDWPSRRSRTESMRQSRNFRSSDQLEPLKEIPSNSVEK